MLEEALEGRTATGREGYYFAGLCNKFFFGAYQFHSYRGRSESGGEYQAPLTRTFNNKCAEYRCYDVSCEIARVLHSKGVGKPEPTPFTEEDMKKYFGGVRFHFPYSTILLIPVVNISVVFLGFKLSMQGGSHSSTRLEEHS